GSGPVTLLMPFLLGQKKTNELLFTGDAIDAPEAERIGLVNRVVADDELEDAVGELVRKIAPTPLPVLRLTKLALLRAYEAMGLRSAVFSNLDLSAILNAADTPEQRQFDELVSTQGLKAARAWRDSRPRCSARRRRSRYGSVPILSSCAGGSASSASARPTARAATHS